MNRMNNSLPNTQGTINLPQLENIVSEAVIAITKLPESKRVSLKWDKYKNITIKEIEKEL